MNFDTTYLAIDLDVIDENFRQIRAKAGGKVLSVVKADAYGHGAVPIARHLESRSDFFGVACAAEAVELWEAGIRKPILILGYTPHSAYPALIKRGIRPVIFCYDDAKALSEAAVRLGMEAAIHFAVDTGMSRIGFQTDEEGAAECIRIAALPGITVEGAFSHYATADETDLSKARGQAERFDAFLENLKALGLEIPLIHLSNSAGVMNFAQRYSMVRAGIVLYGYYPSKEVDPGLLPIAPALSWHSRISMLKTLPAGREISYGATHTTTRTTRLATVPVGYADGYIRSLSNTFYVLIRGKRAPVLGRVCMDQLMVDVTDIPEAQAGDPVVLIGKSGEEEITLEQISEAAGIFHYEFLCHLHRRIPRYYMLGEKVVLSHYYLPDE